MSSLKKSLAMQARATGVIPGMTQLLSKRPDMFSRGVWPGYYQDAAGARVRDLDGNDYLDMSIGGIGANVLGYADPEVDAAVMDAIRRGSSCSLNSPLEVELAERLVALHPWSAMVRYARSGGEAMAIAVRIARTATGRDVVAVCGYHGWHDWYLAANLVTTEALNGHHLRGLEPLGVPAALAGTTFPFRYNHLEDLEAVVAKHGDRLAAVVMEPLRNARPQDDFLHGVRRLADAAGAVLVVDEISAGMRMTTGGAHLKLFPDSPDMAVFSKALGNGYAISAVLGTREVMEAAQKTFISSTNWTEAVGFAAALATLRRHESLDAPARLARIGERVDRIWREASGRHGVPIAISGEIPSIMHFTFEDHPAPQAAKAYFTQRLLDQGILGSTLFYGMCAHTMEDLDVYAEAVDVAMADLARADTAGDLEKLLRGRPSQVGFQRLA